MKCVRKFSGGGVSLNFTTTSCVVVLCSHPSVIRYPVEPRRINADDQRKKI